MYISNIQSLRFLQTRPDARQEEIARHIGKSLSTVKRITPSLIERGFLARENGKRNGQCFVAAKRMVLPATAVAATVFRVRY